jgi:hypothetical protein
MILTKQQWINLRGFLERAPCTGKEAFVWAELYTLVSAHIDGGSQSSAPPHRDEFINGGKSQSPAPPHRDDINDA